MPPNAIVSQDAGDLQIGIVNVYLEFTADTSGAVPSTFTTATGIVSVTKSTNDYIVLFDSAYLKLLDFNGSVLQASFAASGACYVNASATSFTDDSPTVTVSPYKGSDGTAVALAEGDVLRCKFTFTYLPQPNE